MNRMYMIGNTHFDPVWLWTWDEGLASIRSTFRAALQRMDEDKDFVYSFSCPPVFEQLETVDPELMERIRQRVKEGRWALDEGLWVQPDCFSAGLESYVRQCLYGQLYLKEHFGKISDTVFNVDSFGHPAMLTQVYRQARMKYSVISRPDSKDMDMPDPLFRWVGPEGSDILTCRVNMTGGVYPVDTEGAVRKALPMLDQAEHDLMAVYGVTNHGGAPTKKSIAAIHALNEETGGRVVFGSTTDFFSRQEAHDLPQWDGEIPIRHFGVFVNRPDIKKLCRTSENALINAEKAAFWAKESTGLEDQTGKMRGFWQQLLYNQFHDILGGASISEACTDALQQMGGCRQQAESVKHIALQRMTKNISLPAEDGLAWNLAVWNLNPHAYSGWLEAELQWIWEFDWYRGNITLMDEKGNEIPCQQILPKTPIPGFRTRHLFKAEIPPMGWRVFRVLQKDSARDLQPVMSVGENMLCDGKISLTLDEAGGIEEIRDVQSGKVLMRGCAKPVMVEDASDVWAFNFTGYGKEEKFRLQSAKVVENGPMRVSVRVRSVCGNSFVDQLISVYRETGMVEGKLTVNWNEQHKTFKLCFDGRDELTAATPGYAQERAFDGREVPCGGWIDMKNKEDGSGTLLLGDCFHGFDTADGQVRATVLRSPIVGELHIEDLPENDYEYMSQGIFTGSWRVIPHEAADAGFAWREYADFANPPTVIDEANHEGSWPQAGCFLRMDGDAAIQVTALKRAEDGSGEAIVRLSNMSGRTAEGCLVMAGFETLDVALSPYEIRTLRHDGKNWWQTDLLE